MGQRYPDLSVEIVRRQVLERGHPPFQKGPAALERGPKSGQSEQDPVNSGDIVRVEIGGAPQLKKSKRFRAMPEITRPPTQAALVGFRFDLACPDGKLIVDDGKRQPHLRQCDRLDFVFRDLGLLPHLEKGQGAFSAMLHGSPPTNITIP